MRFGQEKCDRLGWVKTVAAPEMHALRHAARPRWAAASSRAPLLRPALPPPPAAAAALARCCPSPTPASQRRRGLAAAAEPVDAWAAGKEDFVALFPQIMEDMNADVRAAGMPPSAQAWIERMVTYTLPGGKLNRGTMVHLMYNDILASRGEPLEGEEYGKPTR